MARKRKHDSLDALDRAVRLEKEAKDYYARLTEVTANELAHRTFHVLAERHDIHSGWLEQVYKSPDDRRESLPEPDVMTCSAFDDIMRQIEHSSSPTVFDISEVQSAIVYSTKMRDTYEHFTADASEEWETRIFESLRREEQLLLATLHDTLDYLRSNLNLAQMKIKD